MSTSTLARPRDRGRRRLLIGATAVALAAALATVLAQPAEAASTPVDGGVYQLAAGASGKCVDVIGASTANGALLQQIACASGTTSQQFRVVATGSGQYHLVNVNSGRCVDVPSGSTSSGLRLQQWGCGDGTKTNQLWTFAASSAAPGKYRATGVASGLCLSDKDGSTAGGNPIVQETCADVARMQWSFNLVSGGGTNPPGTTGPGTVPTVASDGTGRYRTVQAAINAVPAGNTSRATITIKAGTYREQLIIPANKPFITLQGTGSSSSQVVIVFNRNAGDFGSQGSATVLIGGHDFVATNLSISNDFDENTSDTGDQALAVYTNADRAVFTNVRLLADQDTLYIADNTRSYYANSYVEGTVDFIYGGGIVVFNGTEIHEKRATGGPLTAASTPIANPYGMLFYRCSVTGTGTGVTTLGRPWRQDAQVLFRESSMTNTVRVAQPWQDWTTPWRSARYSEYRNTGAGAGTNSNRPQLTDAQAANYTPQRYLAGSDGWNPL